MGASRPSPLPCPQPPSFPSFEPSPLLNFANLSTSSPLEPPVPLQKPSTSSPAVHTHHLDLAADFDHASPYSYSGSEDGNGSLTSGASSSLASSVETQPDAAPVPTSLGGFNLPRVSPSPPSTSSSMSVPSSSAAPLSAPSSVTGIEKPGSTAHSGQDIEFLNLLRAADVPLTHLLDWPAVSDAKATRWPGDLPGGGHSGGVGIRGGGGHPSTAAMSNSLPSYVGLGASLGLDFGSVDGKRW
jgi:hypothetical protein